MGNYSILLVEDELSLRIGMQHALQKAGYAVQAAACAEDALPMLTEQEFDLIISDLRMPGMSGLDLLRHIREYMPELGVILITAFPEVELAVQAIKEGAFDFLCKPFQSDGLLIAVERYCKYLDLKKENTRLRYERGVEFIGKSPAMLKVFDRINSIADACVPVLILGPSGGGKELVASALHNLSGRSSKPFIKINCAALPEQLLESELFGHEKGAFTGAQNARKGKFDAANGGTLFFDELGEMPLAIQAKLLRVLEDQEITPIGGNTPHHVNVRMVFATAKNLEQALEEKTFREDLYYRINIVPIHLPPLRVRGEDIQLLVAHFMEMFCSTHNRKLSLSEEAKQALYTYSYPGNVRELRNSIERAVLLATGDTIRVAELPDRIRVHASSQQEESTKQQEEPILAAAPTLSETRAQVERARILEALAHTGGKKMQAATHLGITRKQLWLKMKELDIQL